MAAQSTLSSTRKWHPQEYSDRFAFGLPRRVGTYMAHTPSALSFPQYAGPRRVSRPAPRSLKAPKRIRGCAWPAVPSALRPPKGGGLRMEPSSLFFRIARFTQPHVASSPEHTGPQKASRPWLRPSSPSTCIRGPSSHLRSDSRSKRTPTELRTPTYTGARVAP